MWLMANHPLAIRAGDSGSPTPAVKERLYITSVEVIEFSYLLEQNENTSKWGWLFRTYMQWHAVAFVLSELCVRPSGPTYERAWKAVESVFDKRILEPTSRQKGMLWKPLRQLWTRAREVREKRPKNNAWSDVPDRVPEFPRPFGLPPPSSIGDSNEVHSNPYSLMSVVHNTAAALDLNLDEYQNENLNGLNHQLPLQQSLDMNIEPDGTDVLPQQTDPTVQNWLTGDGEVNLQTNNDFLKWSGWGPAFGDFAMGADPMASFPVMSLIGNNQGGAQEWY